MVDSFNTLNSSAVISQVNTNGPKLPETLASGGGAKRSSGNHPAKNHPAGCSLEVLGRVIVAIFTDGHDCDPSRNASALPPRRIFRAGGAEFAFGLLQEYVRDRRSRRL
jgi:hypothetical protein